MEVTDHAIVRYLERVVGMDLDPVREQMQPDEKILRALKQMGTERVRYTRNGMKLVVVNGKVVTVYDD